jgi:hypothetical protein
MQLHNLVKNLRFHTLLASCLACCFASAVFSVSAQSDVWFSGSSSMDDFGGNPDSDAFIRIPSDTDDWTRHFSLGAMVGMNISANFSERGTFNLSGNNAANGIYDDGYVRPDQNGDPNNTSYWGYNNRALQYDSTAQTLTMHSTTSYDASGAGKADGGAFAGIEMNYGDNLWYWKHARVGWELGFGLLPIDISDSQSTPAMINQKDYVFSTSTLGILFPSNPSYQGGPSGTGSILSTAYTSSTNNLSGTVTGTHSLDVMLYTFRLGPTFYWDLGEHVGITLGAGPSLGVVSGDYKFNETISTDIPGSTSARNKGSFGATDLVFGGYVSAMVMYHVVENGDIYIGAQYMPMQNADFSSGGRQAQLNLGGQVYISAGINWPF